MWEADPIHLGDYERNKGTIKYFGNQEFCSS